MVRRSVFISYANEDDAARRALELEISSDRLRTLSLTAQINDGQSWQTQVASMLAAADGFVVLIGTNTHVSEPVDWEIDRARREGLPIVGLRLTEDAKNLPRGIRKVELLDRSRHDVRGALEVLVEKSNYIDRLANRIRYHLESGALPIGPIDDLFRIYAALAMAKGHGVTRGGVHNAWSAWMTGVDSSHPSIVPFSELDNEVAALDEPYVLAIRSAVAAMEVSDGNR